MSQSTITLNCAVNGTTYTTNANAAMAAIDSMHSGAVEPTTNLTDGKMWLDTSSMDNIVKIRIGNTWYNLWDFDGTNFYAEQAKLATTVPDEAITEPKLAIDNTPVVDNALYIKTAAVEADDTVTPAIEAADAVMEWRAVPSSAGTEVSANPPAEPNDDDVWIDSDTGIIYTYQDEKVVEGVTYGGNWIQVSMTAQIPDAAVVTTKLANNAVNNDKMADDAIDIAELNAAQETTKTDDAGKVLTVNSTGMGIEWSDSPSALSGGGGLPSSLHGSEEFVVPADANRMVFSASGGGGGGGVPNGGTMWPAGGGGAGGEWMVVEVTAGETVTVSVGTSKGGIRNDQTRPDGNPTTVNKGSGNITFGGGQGGIPRNAPGGAGGTLTGTIISSLGHGDGGTPTDAGASAAGGSGRTRFFDGYGDGGNASATFTTPGGTGAEGLFVLHGFFTA